MRSLLIDSCISLFGERGVHVEVIDDNGAEVPEGSEGSAAVIQIEGALLHGAIGLAAPRALLERTHPLRDRGVLTAEDRRDWVGELTNQLTGRFKNKLLPHGIAFRVHPPTDFIPLQQPAVLAFLALGQRVYVLCAVQLSPGAVLAQAQGSMAEEPHAHEGDVLLF